MTVSRDEVARQEAEAVADARERVARRNGALQSPAPSAEHEPDCVFWRPRRTLQYKCTCGLESAPAPAAPAFSDDGLKNPVRQFDETFSAVTVLKEMFPIASAPTPPAQDAGLREALEAIGHAENLLSAHIERYHDYDYEPHNVPPEVVSLRNIQHHLAGSLIAADGSAALAAHQPAGDGDCRFPDCQCTEAQTAVEAAERVAKRTGRTFVADRSRLQAFGFCETPPPPVISGEGMQDD
jgi:hypothetical protein